MGAYIKGMKMPKDDVHAFKQIIITNNWIDGEVIMLAHDSVTNEFIGGVVEIPEPHGRLIYGDELKTAFPVCDNSTHVMVASVRATINHAPTVIEAEGE